MTNEYDFDTMLSSTKDGILEEVFDTPVESTWVTYEVYKEYVDKIDPIVKKLFLTHASLSVLDYLIERFRLEYFLIQPVGMYNDKILQCETLRTTEFSDIENIFSTAYREDKNVFLYSLVYYPSLPEFYKIDKKSFEPIALQDAPVMTQSYWLFRYATLEK